MGHGGGWRDCCAEPRRKEVAANDPTTNLQGPPEEAGTRRTACREYPHTNRKRFYQILDLSLKNTEICPAVADVFEGLKKL